MAAALRPIALRIAGFVLAGCAWSPLAMSMPPLSQTRTFHLEAQRTRVFPLFTPLGERAWAPGWNPELLSGSEQRGSVFRTRGHDQRETTWIVAEYRADETRVSYARLAQGSNMGMVDVSCRDGATGGTDVTVRYTLTGVTPEGEGFVREFLSAAHYDHFMAEWQQALTAALRASR
jgi:hypothetical protein